MICALAMLTSYLSSLAEAFLCFSFHRLIVMSSTGRIVCPEESFGSFVPVGTGGILIMTGVVV